MTDAPDFAQEQNMPDPKGPDDCAEHILLQARKKGQEHWTNIYAAQLSQFVGYGCEVRALATPVQADHVGDATDMVLHPLSEIREWDEALAVLGIQDSDQTPAGAIRERDAEIERLRAALAQGSISDQDGVGEYHADYSPIAPEEIAKDDPALAELRSMSRPVEDKRVPAYCGDSRMIEVSAATWDGMREYLKALHQAGAVDDTKMKFQQFFPLEFCLSLWGISVVKGDR